MYHIVLIPIDGSEHADKALRYALPLAKALQGEVILLNVQPSFHTPNVKRFFNEDSIHEYQEQLAQEAMEKAVAIVNEAGVTYRTKLRIGVPKTEICAEAKEAEATCIVMGSRGLSPVSGSLLGSVSYGVLHESPCPVTVVP
ncbi:universal stress protein [Brevibacillus dissolubilis]|uniref:universal stress protein n=1 Tax=Brevibacillus dissolubilis TaxID=1844116 RepID=UPI00111649C0|nr:universal stress protein [Brevibacillus dissolubilis]